MRMLPRRACYCPRRCLYQAVRRAGKHTPPIPAPVQCCSCYAHVILAPSSPMKRKFRLLSQITPHLAGPRLSTSGCEDHDGGGHSGSGILGLRAGRARGEPLLGMSGLSLKMAIRAELGCESQQRGTESRRSHGPTHHALLSSATLSRHSPFSQAASCDLQRLTEAVRNGDIEEVRRLLESGVGLVPQRPLPASLNPLVIEASANPQENSPKRLGHMPLLYSSPSAFWCVISARRTSVLATQCLVHKASSKAGACSAGLGSF